jgi:outer membrane murein-binding lipoprotein Lpp
MSRSWILAAVAAILVCGSQAFAVEPADDLKNLNSKQDTIIKKLDEIMNRVISLDNRLYSLEQANNSNEKEVRELKRQVESLRNEMNTLRTQVNTPGSTSMSSPLGGPNATAPTVPTGMSMLQLHNDFPSAMDVVVNGKTIQLLPNQTANVTVTPGTFKYRVVGVDTADRQRTVAAGKVYYARIYPVMAEVPVIVQ